MCLQQLPFLTAAGKDDFLVGGMITHHQTPIARFRKSLLLITVRCYIYIEMDKQNAFKAQTGENRSGLFDVFSRLLSS